MWVPNRVLIQGYQGIIFSELLIQIPGHELRRVIAVVPAALVEQIDPLRR